MYKYVFICTNLTPMAQDVTRSFLSLNSLGEARPRLIVAEADGRRLPSMREDVPEGRVSWYLQQQQWLFLQFCSSEICWNLTSKLHRHSLNRTGTSSKPCWTWPHQDLREPSPEPSPDRNLDLARLSPPKPAGTFSGTSLNPARLSTNNSLFTIIPPSHATLAKMDGH